MRRNSLSHGTGSFASRRLRAGKSANSSAVRGGASGTSRKYHAQTRTQMRLNTASTTNEPRQDTRAIKTAISGGVTALPSREGGLDFLLQRTPLARAIVTNPPFN